ncbi:MAG: hypothetical protein ABIA78_01200 [archaeon]
MANKEDKKICTYEDYLIFQKGRFLCRCSECHQNDYLNCEMIFNPEEKPLFDPIEKMRFMYAELEWRKNWIPRF